ncbi:cytochrome c oxidase subunit 3 [uncultured Sphingomonas sp.]|uniref:cytochrome c oxidase subunit 3 n=1 Tax=uncultured Sphingomonas sp. TaxID=158754 RepID=UPI00261C587F|nr:cytochrome c oxidase subunit 3 [uncultured Sphingomonas sp.]
MTARALYPGPDLTRHADMAEKDAEQGLFGFWLFLMSDAVIFALLFATYGVMLSGTAGGPTPRDVFELQPAFIETGLLLASSFTWGMASLALKYRDSRARLLAWMAVTLFLGLGFLAMELHDFATMFAKGAIPARSGFLSGFFALVPLHGLHVATGCLWIVVMAAQVMTIGVDARVKVNLLRLGLFWHFLDIIWIAIFSVVYLQGLAA